MARLPESVRPISGPSSHCITHLACLWPTNLMRHGPFLAPLVFSNEKACNNIIYLHSWAETWRRIWGDQQKIFAAQFQEKWPFSGYKFLMTFFYFFLVIDLVLRIFP